MLYLPENVRQFVSQLGEDSLVRMDYWLTVVYKIEHKILNLCHSILKVFLITSC